ncbi:TPA: restriction endonuclease subunit S [Clostridium perfringens]|nr:restriction endonuclease subunit S [Clostridium perfringens]
MTYMNLIDVCDFQGGSQPPKDKWITQYKDGYIRMLQIRDFTQKRDERDYVEVSNRIKICKKDDVLIARYGASVGKILTGLEGAYNVAIIKSIPSKLIDKRYLYYYFNSSYFQNFLKNVGSRAAQAGFNKEDLREAKIFVPKIEHQRNIVSILNKSKNLIERRKNQIEQLDLLVKSKFIEMFGNPITNSKGWNIKLLGEVCEMKAGKNIKSADIYEKNNGKLYPCYGGNGLRGYVRDYSHDGNIPLIGRQGALCGNVKYAKGKFYATEHAVVTNPKIEMNTYWLYYILEQLDLNRLSTGAAQPGLTVGKLKEVELPIAPIGMQNDFENFAKQVDKLKFEMEKSLKELEDNFNSLMNKAFKGELF